MKLRLWFDQKGDARIFLPNGSEVKGVKTVNYHKNPGCMSVVELEVYATVHEVQTRPRRRSRKK